MSDTVMTDDSNNHEAAECLVRLSMLSTSAPPSPASTVEDEQDQNVSTAGTPSPHPIVEVEAPQPHSHASYAHIIDEPTTQLTDETIEYPCMYDDECDTDAPRRKCISHIFGRNKTCTRRIPKGMWLYHCRKHYQRARYRADGEWAREQSAVIRRQFSRVWQWDEIEGWNIQPVKKEREAIIAGFLGGQAEYESPEAGPDSEAGANGSLIGTWAWLRKEFGPMDNEDVYGLLMKIDGLLYEHNAHKYPRIEILPTFRDDPKKPKKADKKKDNDTTPPPPPPSPKRRSPRRSVRKSTDKASGVVKIAQSSRSRNTRSTRMDIGHVLN
jgi:hypothetical protein